VPSPVSGFSRVGSRVGLVEHLSLAKVAQQK